MVEWIIEAIARGGYLGIVLLMAVENIFPPIPSEVIMGLGGINVAQGRMRFVPLLIAGTLGSVAGNYVWYLAGVKLGLARLRPLVDRWGRWLTIEWEDIETADRFFKKRGHLVVFFLRFSPFLRTVISLPAGLSGMRPLKFMAYTMAGAAVWNTVLIGAGFYLGQNYAALERYTTPIAIGFVVLSVIVYVWRLIRWKPRAER